MFHLRKYILVQSDNSVTNKKNTVCTYFIIFINKLCEHLIRQILNVITDYMPMYKTGFKKMTISFQEFKSLIQF